VAGSGDNKAHKGPRSGVRAPSVPQPRVNTLSIVSIVLVVVALAGSVFGGTFVLAVFAVGAGHVALQQINERGQRGAILAYIGIGISYLIAVFALVDSVYLFLQFKA
jgi:Domain of unknown function (DUF4190)